MEREQIDEDTDEAQSFKDFLERQSNYDNNTNQKLQSQNNQNQQIQLPNSLQKTNMPVTKSQQKYFNNNQTLKEDNSRELNILAQSITQNNFYNKNDQEEIPFKLLKRKVKQKSPTQRVKSKAKGIEIKYSKIRDPENLPKRQNLRQSQVILRAIHNEFKSEEKEKDFVNKRQSLESNRYLGLTVTEDKVQNERNQFNKTIDQSASRKLQYNDRNLINKSALDTINQMKSGYREDIKQYETRNKSLNQLRNSQDKSTAQSKSLIGMMLPNCIPKEKKFRNLRKEFVTQIFSDNSIQNNFQQQIQQQQYSWLSSKIQNMEQTYQGQVKNSQIDQKLLSSIKHQTRNELNNTRATFMDSNSIEENVTDYNTNYGYGQQRQLKEGVNKDRRRYDDSNDLQSQYSSMIKSYQAPYDENRSINNQLKIRDQYEAQLKSHFNQTINSQKNKSQFQDEPVPTSTHFEDRKVQDMMFRTSVNLGKDIDNNYTDKLLKDIVKKRILEDTLSSKNKQKKKQPLDLDQSILGQSLVGYEDTQRFINSITGKNARNVKYDFVSTTVDDNNSQGFIPSTVNQFNPFNMTRTSLVQPSNRILFQSSERTSTQLNIQDNRTQDQFFKNKNSLNPNPNSSLNINQQNLAQTNDYQSVQPTQIALQKKQSTQFVMNNTNTLRLMNPKQLRVDELKNTRYRLNQLFLERQQLLQQEQMLNQSLSKLKLSQTLDLQNNSSQAYLTSQQSQGQIIMGKQYVTKTSEKFFIPLKEPCESKKLCSCGRHSKVKQQQQQQKQQTTLNLLKEKSSQLQLSRSQSPLKQTMGLSNNVSQSLIQGNRSIGESQVSLLIKSPQRNDGLGGKRYSTIDNARTSLNKNRESMAGLSKDKSSEVASLRSSSVMIRGRDVSPNMSTTNMSITRIQNIPKPQRFTLRDLPKYSQTLRAKKYDALQLKQVLGGKYYKPTLEEKKIVSPPKSPSRVVEWSKTPAYKQFVLKLTEMDSLDNSQVGFRKYKLNNKNKTQQEFELEMKDKKLMRSLLEKTLKNVYSESEVQYLITLNKNKTLAELQMHEIIDKVTDTLEVLMCKLGLKEQFEHVIQSYEQDFINKNDSSKTVQQKRETLIKELFRCKQMYQSLGQIETIFKIIKVRESLEKKIEKIEEFRENMPDNFKNPIALNYDLPVIKEIKDLPQEQKDQLEEYIAMYCYQSSRLFIQITSFLIESQLFRRFKFLYFGQDLQLKIRQDISDLREKYDWEFGEDKIPTMDELGKLIFSEIIENSEVFQKYSHSKQPSFSALESAMGDKQIQTQVEDKQE